jgi:hypothetical protein
MNIEIALTNISRRNKRLKMSKAIKALSEKLGVPVSIDYRKKDHTHGPEPFIFRAQEELNYKWQNKFSLVLKEAYDFVIKYMSLPEIPIISKAAQDGDEPLTHKGKIIYNPQNGEPIKKSDWEAFIEALEKFLNRNLKDTDKKIILESKALGRILNRMLKYNRYDEVTKLPLDKVKYGGKTFDWISESVKNMRTAMGESLSGSEMTRIQVMEMSAGQRITAVSEKVKADVKQVLIDGVLSRKSKSQVSQDLFYKMSGHNRDFQMIADTEIQNAVNNAILLDEVHNSEPGEKVYFQRVEVIDQNTCKFCRKMNGVIALWSDTPLENDKIKDPIADFAIWDGKDWNGQKEFVADGVFHPYCRGLWMRYYNKTVDALVTHLQNKAELYNKALAQARAEYKAKGIENPNDNTPGFLERINELFEENGVMEKAFNPNQRRGEDGKWQKEGMGSVEPWDSSTDKAKELKAEDWGTPGEIAEMAKMPNEADSYAKAREYLEPLVDKPLKSRSGLMGTISKKSIKKILSGDSKNESFDIKAHLKAAANIEKLYTNAIEKWEFELNPNKNNESLNDRKYLYAPMEYKGRIIPVKFTVFLFKERGSGKRIYTVEAIDAEIIKKEDAGILARGLSKSDPAISPQQHPLAYYNIACLFDSVNAYLHRSQATYTDKVMKALYGDNSLKSLTWSGYKLQGRYKFAGFDISVENKAGSIRSGKDKDGHDWHCKMHYDYGYIRGSVGVDGDHVDVYIGPDEDAPYVYVAHQNDPTTGKYDEDKVMLGFPSMKDARQAYLKQYDRPGFLGDIDAIPIDEFREKVLSKKYHGKMVKSLSERVREALGRKL